MTGDDVGIGGVDPNGNGNAAQCACVIACPLPTVCVPSPPWFSTSATNTNGTGSPTFIWKHALAVKGGVQLSPPTPSGVAVGSAQLALLHQSIGAPVMVKRFW